MIRHGFSGVDTHIRARKGSLQGKALLFAEYFELKDIERAQTHVLSHLLLSSLLTFKMTQKPELFSPKVGDKSKGPSSPSQAVKPTNIRPPFPALFVLEQVVKKFSR